MTPLKRTEIIQYIGFEDIDPEEKRLLDKVASEYHAKIKRQLHNLTDLSIHLKVHSKTGSKHRYEIHTKAMAATKMFASNKTEDWDLPTTLHKSLRDLETEVKGKIKDSKEPKLTIRKE